MIGYRTDHRLERLLTSRAKARPRRRLRGLVSLAFF